MLKRWEVALRLIGVGWHIALSIILGVGVGVWLDRRLGTQVLFTLLGLALGLGVAFYGTYQLIRPLMTTKNREDY